MKLTKTVKSAPPADDFAGEVLLHPTVCYDFVVSLRAMFNPRTFASSRGWAGAHLPKLGPMATQGEFFFAGFDTALGYGAARVVQGLPHDAVPGDLVAALRAIPADDLALFMLDTGETSRERLDVFRDVLGGDSSKKEASLRGLPAGWRSRCQRVLEDPEAVRSELVDLLDVHLTEVYSDHMDAIRESIDAAMPMALKTVELLPAFEAIERLTGGYTLGSDLGLRRIILAPSVFIHPFMSARLDDEAGDAVIVYGIPSRIFEGFAQAPVQGDLMRALKAMADPSRMTVLHLLAHEPLYTSEIVRRLHLAQTTVHHHLAQLRSAGLIRQERDRNGMKYSIRKDSATHVLRSLEDWILSPDPDVDSKEPRP